MDGTLLRRNLYLRWHSRPATHSGMESLQRGRLRYGDHRYYLHGHPGSGHRFQLAGTQGLSLRKLNPSQLAGMNVITTLLIALIQL